MEIKRKKERRKEGVATKIQFPTDFKKASTGRAKHRF
jgi:hypothetical protein